MAGKYLVTGGAASGKSRWAISYFKNCGDVLYICTGDKPSEEAAQRMQYGTEHDNVNWTVQCAKRNLASVISDKYRFFVFDNMAEFVQNLILTMCKDPDHITDEQIKEIRTRAIGDIDEMLKAVDGINGEIILITLETGFSLRSHLRAERAFSDILSAVNQRVAYMCNEVYLSVSGVQVKIR
ncbi:MAG: bifunctional adenosylcobinamide kinase/adenosylcobinamide-phosphate guanylyltransferase [Huintestinicola sp.]